MRELFFILLLVSNFTGQINQYLYFDSQDATKYLEKNEQTDDCAIGVELFFQGKTDQALPYLEKGMTEHNNDKNLDTGICALALGVIKNQLSELDMSLKFYYLALDIFNFQDNEYWIGVTLNNLGGLYLNKSDYSNASINFEDALEIEERHDDYEGMLISLNGLGLINLYVGKFEDSLAQFLQIVDIQARENIDTNMGAVINNIGMVYWTMGDLKNARKYFEEALLLRRENFDEIGECITLYDLGGVYLELGLIEKSLINLNNSLKQCKEVNYPRGSITALSSLGNYYLRTGDFQKSKDFYEQALDLANNYDLIGLKSQVLNDSGRVFLILGDFSKALGFFEESSIIDEQTGNLNGIGVSKQNIGMVYLEQGRFGAAKKFFDEAYEIAIQTGNLKGQSENLSGISNIYIEMRDLEKGIDYATKSLSIQKRIGDQAGIAYSLANLGAIYAIQNKFEKSEESLLEAKEISDDINDDFLKGSIFLNLADLYFRQNKFEVAERYFSESLSINERLESSTLEIQILDQYSILMKKTGRETEAIALLEEAVNSIETTMLLSDTDISKIIFQSKFIRVYDNLIGLLIDQQQFEKAFMVSEGVRARGFIDSLSKGSITLFDGLDNEIFRNIQNAFRSVKITEEELIKAKALNEIGQEEIQILEDQVIQRKQEYNYLLNSISSTNDRLNQILPITNQGIDIKSIQDLLDSKSTILSYWLLEDRIIVFIISNSSFSTEVISIQNEELNSIITSFLSFSNIEEPVPNSTQKLFQILISPIEDLLKTENLIIIPNGILHYLPFSALHSGSEYLIENFTIRYLPSAASIQFFSIPQKETSKEALVFGNPKTEDESLKPLSFSEEEVTKIADLLKTQPFVGSAAKESKLKSMASSIGIIHLAAHTDLNQINPLLASIFLAPGEGEDGILEVYEIYNLDLREANLVVLSGCETNIGAMTLGDDIIGLTRAFFLFRITFSNVKSLDG